jgi:HEPN domain-containing protein
MRPPEEVLRSLVQQWIAKADLDFQAAEQLLRAGDSLREIVAFHCQQAAEKYLKAFLVRHRVEFPKTHNIGALLDLVARVTPEMASGLGEAAALTPYGVDIRYPDDFPDVLPGQERKAFEVASRAREAVLARLEPYLSGG